MTYNIDKSHKDLTAEIARSLFNYNKETGVFEWRERAAADKSWNSKYAGKECGRIVKGYRYIRVGNCEYRAHRLAWLIVTGEWPDQEIDHIDGKRDDNRLCNLRLATRVIQGHNRRASGKSKILGVHWCKKNLKWYAFTRLDGRKKNLGGFDCPAVAAITYQIAVFKKIGNHIGGRSVAV